jgi:hypothetical protein
MSFWHISQSFLFLEKIYSGKQGTASAICLFNFLLETAHKIVDHVDEQLEDALEADIDGVLAQDSQLVAGRLHVGKQVTVDLLVVAFDHALFGPEDRMFEDSVEVGSQLVDNPGDCLAAGVIAHS